MDETTATATLDGLTVTVTLTREEGGDVIARLSAPGSFLDGFAPAEYAVIPNRDHTYRDDTACPACHAPYCHRSPEAVARRRADVFMSDGGEI